MATQNTCLHCREPLPEPGPHGGRPRKFCSDPCRWAFRRGLTRRWRPVTRLHNRQTSTAKHRKHLRDQAEHLAQAAGKLALDTHEEDLAPISQQTGWKPGPIAGYTAAALPLHAQARAVLAAAVAADRAAGATWDEIAAVLEVSTDTASRRYRS
jgi:enamine deaminase RidA (YjgF/YER057c/UK114 family)